MKLGLGTVQLGMNYGINNHTGKPELQQIKSILSVAESNGIDLLDTAADYGDSEDNLGKVDSNFFKIVTKVSRKSSARESVSSSLVKLNRKSIYGVLIHDFDQMRENISIWNELIALKESGKVQKIGFSLYNPRDLDYILSSDFNFDLIQVPYSVFDRRFEKYFATLKLKGVEIHVRSIFLQGLVFVNTDELPDFFSPIKPKLQRLVSLGAIAKKSIHSLCLNFAMQNDSIDKVIIGVDTVQNLTENVAVIKEQLSMKDIQNLSELQEENEQMILPYNWKK